MMSHVISIHVDERTLVKHSLLHPIPGKNNRDIYLQSEQVHLINQFIVVQVNSEHFYIRLHEYFNSLKSS